MQSSQGKSLVKICSKPSGTKSQIIAPYHFATPRGRQYDVVMNLGFPEMIFLFLLALLIFGPRKLPEIGRQVGRALAEFKRASNEFKSQIESEINQIDLEERQQ